MKVLLTGANGFIGSRILARLVEGKIPTVALLRPTASRDLIQQHLTRVRIAVGALDQPDTLTPALTGVTHVIHCAGKTKALKSREFDQVNAMGTRHLVEAIQGLEQPVNRVVYLSTLAACGPATTQSPARETDPPGPISAYGRSKLAAERVLRNQEKLNVVLLRPGGVYGPGDRDFFQMFLAVKRGWCPLFGDGQQVLNLVYADDLARVLVGCLNTETVPKGVYHVAHPHVCTAKELFQAIAAVMDRQPRFVSLPSTLLVPISWGGDLLGRWTGRPSILSTDRRHELMAPGWVCDTAKLKAQTGLECTTALHDGLRSTRAWYEKVGWL